MATLDQNLATATQYIQPGIDAYAPALQGLQELLTPQGQASAVNQYTSSDMYNQQMASAQEAAARAANATGYGRSAQAVIEQSQIPLSLQQNYLNDQTARYAQLAGFAAPASSQAYSGTMNQGQFGAQLAQNKQMASDSNKSNFWGDILGLGATVGGAILGGPIGSAIGSGIGTALGGPIVGSGTVNTNYQELTWYFQTQAELSALTATCKA